MVRCLSYAPHKAPDQLQLLKTLGFESCLAAISQLFCLTVFRPCAQFELNNGADVNG